MQTRKLSINRLVLMYMVLISIFSIGILGYLWISSEWSRFEAETLSLRAGYLEERKAVLKREVARALNFVKYMQSQTEKRLRDTIKNRVYEAYAIADNIYQQYRNKLPTAEIETLIREALRPIRFNKDRGYFFAFSLDGVETLFAARPEMEGKNMLAVKGGNGEPVVPDMLTLVRKKGEGFYRYNWSKPNQEGYFPKIAFVKLFEPTDWVIGTGEYLDDVENDIQVECLKWISNIKFGQDGYVFAGRWDGISLSGPAIGKNMYDVQDVNGVKIVQELIQAARQEGGFVHYILPRFEGKKHASKISYAVGIPEWQWYIGSGVYVDEIETAIALKQSQLQHRIKTNIRNNVIVLTSLLVFILLIVQFLSNRLQKNLALFTRFFNRASSEAIKIERAALHFAEFDQLAESANQMVEKQKQVEDALQTSHERFLTVLDSIDATIYVADMETYEILFMNKHMIDSFGHDLTGQICWQVFRKESQPCPRCTNEQLIDEFGKPTDVCVWQGKNPITGKWYINYDRAIEWSDGRLVKLQIATDITDLKKMEEDLRQSHKMEAIGTLAGGIAHEFNNILSIIIGNTELAMDDLPEHNPAYNNLERIKTAGFRAKEIVLQLLSFSRKTEEHLKPVILGQIVREALTFLRSTIPTTVQITTDIESDGPVILADPTQINQVMINLCLNATQAMGPSGGNLTIRVDHSQLEGKSLGSSPALSAGEYVKLTVRDTGPGIEKGIKGRIFDPFFTTKEVGKGSGMGLAVVHGIVLNHGGDITVESPPGEGSTFTLFFPVASEIPATESIASEDMPSGNESILFVDDEEPIVQVTRNLLESLGYGVEARTDPTEALALFASKPTVFDLVITDMTMPRLNGVELSQKLRQIRTGLPIILCTGHSDLVNESKATELGIAAYVLKPIVRKEIAKTIRRVLDEVNGIA